MYTEIMPLISEPDRLEQSHLCRHRFRHRFGRRGKKWTFHHQGTCLSLWLSWFYPLGHSSHWFGANHCSCTICHHCQKLVCRQSHPADHPPTLFAGSRPRVLLLVPKGEGAAGWPLIDPGEPQEDLGRGQQNCPRRDIQRCVPPMVWVAWKVRADRRWPMTMSRKAKK